MRSPSSTRPQSARSSNISSTSATTPGARATCRLGAIHSFFQYCALRHPEHSALIARVLAIPPKRGKKRTVTFLTPEEVQALLDAPDRTTWAGRRDHALLLTAVQTGLRASEVLGPTRADTQLGTGAHVRTLGEGRKERVAPLTTQTVAVLKVWMRVCDGDPRSPLFPSRDGRSLTRDAVEHRLAKHVTTARRSSDDDAFSKRQVSARLGERDLHPVINEHPPPRERSCAFARVSLPGECRESPVVSVGVCHREIARWIVGLIHERVHDRGADLERSLHHSVRIRADDMQRARARPAGRASLAGARQQHATAHRPIQLAVMDEPLLLSGDHQLLGEAETKQPVAQHQRVVADDARLPYSAIRTVILGYRSLT